MEGTGGIDNSHITYFIHILMVGEQITVTGMYMYTTVVEGVVATGVMSGSIEEDLKLLLDGKVVPIHQDEDIVTKYLVQQETDYVPIVKRTVGYIAMGLDGVKREILEEAGVEVDVVSLVAIEMYDSLSWFRICFIARPSGGKLKTLAEQDEESLQAQWFDIDKIKNGTLNLRGQDFFKVMDLAQDYLSRSKDCQHPAYQEIFQTSSTTQLKSEGMLTLEHCGIPSREHDGLCVTVVYIVPEHLLDTLVEN
ncbi:NDX1-like protein [Mya arenaria]|uniref:NDX1-like protein n=1 Tax=Mya arenaria TaxID=6604 RepID=A0ABY7EIM1_MYAAR|nr:NDX1-like protein [Mya arenaria]